MLLPRVRDTYTHLAIWTNAQMKLRLEEVFRSLEKWRDSGALSAEKVVKFGERKCRG